MPISTTKWLVVLAAIIAVAGCRGPQPSFSPAARIRREARAKLRTGMTPAEVQAILGKPSEFRAARAAGRDDVGVYPVGDGTLTVYFFHGRLTRMRDANAPVNR